jgi:hypothetical protein
VWRMPAQYANTTTRGGEGKAAVGDLHPAAALLFEPYGFRNNFGRSCHAGAGHLIFAPHLRPTIPRFGLGEDVR